MNKKAIADIFIPTSNRINALDECLNSLNGQSNKRFRVILVGLSSDKNINRLVGKYINLDIIYIIQKQKGLIGAANEALDIATASLFIRIDDDVILDQNWFSELVKTYLTSPKIGGVTGPTLMSKKGLSSRDLTKYLTKFSKSKNIFFKFLGWIYLDILYEGKIYDVSTFLPSGVFTIGSNFKSCLKLSGLRTVNNLEACNWSSRTKLLRAIGGFDSNFSSGLGDYHEADSAMKIMEMGYQLVFNPKVILRHNVEKGSVAKSRPNAYHRIQNFIVFYFRHLKSQPDRKLTRFLLNIMLQNAYYISRAFVARDLSQLLSVPGTIVGFFKVLLVYIKLIQ